MSGTNTRKTSASAARLKDTATKRAPGAARVTKKQQLIRLLGKKAGADIGTLSAKFGWQRHTTRAALSGLRKAGFELTKIEASGGQATRYRIVQAPPEPSTAGSKEKAVLNVR